MQFIPTIYNLFDFSYNYLSENIRNSRFKYACDFYYNLLLGMYTTFSLTTGCIWNCKRETEIGLSLPTSLGITSVNGSK